MIYTVVSVAHRRAQLFFLLTGNFLRLRLLQS